MRDTCGLGSRGVDLHLRAGSSCGANDSGAVATGCGHRHESTVTAIIANAPPKWRLALRVLEQTGMRAGELAKLEWQDADSANSRFRIRGGKTAGARRWVTVPERLMHETVPPDDRTPERRVFPGATRQLLGQAMRRGCQPAGLPLYSPHDLRHRYASVKIREGVPVTDLAAQLGHARKSMTLDTYSHVPIQGRCGALPPREGTLNQT